MLKPTKRVLVQYFVLLFKMHLDAPTVHVAKKNFECLTDVQSILGLLCLLPLVEQLNQLIKFAQGRNIFVCDFVAALRVCQAQLFTNYQDPRSSYLSDAFFDFNSLVDFTHDAIKMVWKEGLNTGDEQLVFDCMGVPIWAQQKFDHSDTPRFINREDSANMVAAMKVACRG